MDRHHHCAELAVRKPTQFQNLRRKSCIAELPPERWNHVAGVENSADCASKGLFPLKLLDHSLWWEGPTWLQLPPTSWPKQPDCLVETYPEEVKETCLVTTVEVQQPIITLTRYTTYV